MPFVAGMSGNHAHTNSPEDLMDTALGRQVIGHPTPKQHAGYPQTPRTPQPSPYKPQGALLTEVDQSNIFASQWSATEWTPDSQQAHYSTPDTGPREAKLMGVMPQATSSMTFPRREAQLLVYVCRVGQHESVARCVIDCGACMSAISPDYYSFLQMHMSAHCKSVGVESLVPAGRSETQKGMTCEVVMVDAPLWLMGKAYLLGEVAVMPIAGYDVLLGMNWLTHNEATVVMTPGQQSLRLADGTTIPFSRPEKEPHDKYDDEAEGAAGLDDNRALLTIALDAGTMPEPLYFRAQPQTDDPPETRPTTPPWDSPHQHSDEDWADAVDAACSHMSGGGDEKAEMRGLIDEYRDIFSSQVDVFRPMSVSAI